MTEPIPGQEIRVALVDDQILFRAGLQMLIDSQSDMIFCGGARDGEEAVALAASASPDVMLMDLRMPVMNGVEATQRIVEAARAEGSEKPKIIALTTFNRDEAVVGAIRAGASGFLLKSVEPEFLLAAIRTVNSGHAVIAPGATHELFQSVPAQAASAGPDLESIAELSAREKNVFLLVAKGLSNAEIAGNVFASEATVKSQVRSILSKLGVRTRIQLVAFAYEHRLLG
ncbi:response regulator transcription factor [Arthrobacter sp. GMC3]|uniref:response regulator n=1 Tax=Arthrobacter sp. GMC3 TaxID=2058894 RepID=UPI000CE4E9B6|nr:response regulator transcription factor [Arthrobacter sp. GMC3]